MKTYKNLILIILLIINLIFFTISSMYIIKHKKSTYMQNKKNGKNQSIDINYLSIGDKITIDNISYIVNNLRISLGNDYEKPKNGYAFYLVDLTIQNTGSKIKTIDVNNYLKLTNYSKTKYFNHAIFSGQEKCLNSDIMPGKSIRGEITFEVPLPKTLLTIKNYNPKNKYYYKLSNIK